MAIPPYRKRLVIWYKRPAQLDSCKRNNVRGLSVLVSRLSICGHIEDNNLSYKCPPDSAQQLDSNHFEAENSEST